MSRSRNPPSPLLIRSSVLVLAAFTAAAAFNNMALASSAVPNWPCAKVVDEAIRTAAHAAAIMHVRTMDFLPTGGRRWRAPEQNAAVGDSHRTGVGWQLE